MAVALLSSEALALAVLLLTASAFASLLSPSPPALAGTTSPSSILPADELQLPLLRASQVDLPPPLASADASPLLTASAFALLSKALLALAPSLLLRASLLDLLLK